MSARRAWALVVLSIGCGHGARQRALLTSPPSTVRVAATAALDEVRWIVIPETTRFEVRGTNPFLGERRFHFRRFHASITGSREATFHAVIDTRSVEGPFSSLVRDRLLEADRFPEATFDGMTTRTGAGDACVVDGILTLHGIAKSLHFDGHVREELDLLSISAIFDVPRSAFDLAFHDSRDRFLPDYVSVVLDIWARRKRVETVPLE